MIEFSVDACDPETYAVVRKGLEWDVLVDNAKRMLSHAQRAQEQLQDRRFRGRAERRRYRCRREILGRRHRDGLL